MWLRDSNNCLSLFMYHCTFACDSVALSADCFLILQLIANRHTFVASAVVLVSKIATLDFI